MGVIDWPAPVLSNTAYFKREPTLPNGAGSTRRYTIPKIEAGVLGLRPYDRVMVRGYDPEADKGVKFESGLSKKVKQGATDQYRFTIPLGSIEDGEFTKGGRQQFVVRRTGRLDPPALVPPERVSNLGMFKTRPEEKNKGVETDSTLRINAIKRETEPLSLTEGDRVYVTMVRTPADSSLSGRLSSVNRSAFSAILRDSGIGRLYFTVPAKRRRIKDYQPDVPHQVVLVGSTDRQI